MDALDIFPEAGIRFVSVQHEQNAGHMADGYARISGKHGVCIAQNGPGTDHRNNEDENLRENLEFPSKKLQQYQDTDGSM